MEKSIETKNGRIVYWLERISSQNPTVVFLHGLSSNHLTWLPSLPLFHQAGFNTLNIDLRGHGFSDKTRERDLYHIPVMSEDLKQIIEKENLGAVYIVGYSYGGYVGMDFSISHPELVRGLVLISANHVSPFDYHWFSFMSPLSRFIINSLGWIFVWQSRKKYHYFNPVETRGYWRTTFSGYATMPLSINFWMLSEVFTLDYSRTIGKIACPTLIIRGTGDNFISDKEVKDMLAKIKGSKEVLLEAGHYVAAKSQEQTAENILAFLKTLS